MGHSLTTFLGSRSKGFSISCSLIYHLEKKLKGLEASISSTKRINMARVHYSHISYVGECSWTPGIDSTVAQSCIYIRII